MIEQEYTSLPPVQSDRRKTVLVIVVVALLLLGAVFLLTQSNKSTTTPSTHSQTLTVITSPLSNTTTQLAINYGGSVNPNYDAVNQPFKLFTTDGLHLPDSITKALTELLPTKLATLVTPTYSPTYIQVDRRNIHCSSPANCTLSVYIDSPESYFSVHFSQVNGTFALSVTPESWKGVQQ